MSRDIPVVLVGSNSWDFHVGEVGIEGVHDMRWLKNIRRQCNNQATEFEVSGVVD